MKKKSIPKSSTFKIKGSEKSSPDALKLSTINTNESIEVTIRVRRKKSIEPILKDAKRYTHEDYEREFGASQKDIDIIEKFASDNHLSISNINYARRTVILKGKIKYFESAFQVHLSNYQHKSGNIFRGRTGAISIPTQLASIVEGVFGLDNRPVATPKFQFLKKQGFLNSRTNTFEGYSANEISKAYGFPKNVTGKGQCIAMIELDGGYRNKDLETYFHTLNLPLPSVKSVSVGDGFNNPSTPDSSDGEVLLDIEVAGAVAPDAKIIVYFAPNTDKGFLDAITTAIHDTINKPSIISISWGGAESTWSEQSLRSYNEAFKAASLLGITICAASGDQGSSDQKAKDENYDGLVHADFPSSSPYVLACGGTKINIKNGSVNSEVVWNDDIDSATGGGVSEFFPRPDYQSSTAIPLSIERKFKGRGLPDIAGNASPNSGYKVLVDGEWGIVGGTSAVAPLMAAFFALTNEKNGNKSGFIHPTLYSKPQSFCRDISTGNNITTPSKKGYKAKKGWDPCTGWGVMNKF
ncbi:MAG: S53 family peptidase [Bacteroidia bacterium]